jgi:hypothetical protein
MSSKAAEPGVGVIARFEEDALLKQAMEKTGLSDFGDEAFREGLGVLIEALEGEAGLNDFGRGFAHAEIMKHLENRLRVTEDLKRHPEILDVQVDTPIVIVSLPRTGTTLLHNLLARDPDTRYTATWECNLLSPPPESATWESDPRVEQFARAIEAAHGSGAPGFDQLHPMGSTLPEECVVLLGFDFKSQVFNFQFDIPSYEMWFEEQDLQSLYETHHRLLQYLQWRCPRKRWVLKTPGHLWGLKEFFRVYPDAQVVQTHRDPLRVLASFNSLLNLGLGMTREDLDASAMGAHWDASWAKALRKAIAFRDSDAVSDSSFFDVQYGDLVEDPIERVREIYQYFGVEYSAAAEQRMTGYLAENRKKRHGVHRYTLEQFGLDPQETKERYQFYIDRFEVECSFGL